MTDGLHICHLLHHLAQGGLETQVLRILEATREDVSFSVAYFGNDSSMRSSYEEAGVPTSQFVMGSDDPLRQFSPAVLKEVTTFLTQKECDILHAHGELYLLVLARLCGRLADVPVVGTYHNPAHGFSRMTQVAERISRSLSTVNIAVSKDVERSYANSAKLYRKGTGLQRATYTVQNGIDVEGFRKEVEAAPTDELRSTYNLDEKLVFLNIGRYTKQKNQQSLIRAMAAVVDSRPEAHLFVVGWGPKETELKQLAVQHGIEDNVDITGQVPSVHRYYSAADVFVLSSRSEGLSVVLLEAMAAGLPVIGTNVSGTAEAVVDGETGAIVPSESSSKLAERMQEMTAVETRRRYGEKAYERAKNEFDIGRTAGCYVDVYEQIQSTITD